jgi:putative hydrolase of HD superfamily
MNDDLRRRMAFVLDVDALKRIDRRNAIRGGSRAENTAEHSWHLALMAMVLAPYCDEPVDAARVIEMLLVHDLVEIDAGDTFAYDDASQADKPVRERRAADRVFSTLPDRDGRRLRALWDEYEAQATIEARFARALDLLQAFLLNHENAGALWREHGIDAARVRARNAQIATASVALERFVQENIDGAVAAGWLRE